MSTRQTIKHQEARPHLFSCPTGVTVSEAPLFRREQEIARHYEQGTPKERVWAYLRRWLGRTGGWGIVWVIIGCVCMGISDFQGDEAGVTSIQGRRYLRDKENARLICLWCGIVERKLGMYYLQSGKKIYPTVTDKRVLIIDGKEYGNDRINEGPHTICMKILLEEPKIEKGWLGGEYYFKRYEHSEELRGCNRYNLKNNKIYVIRNGMENQRWVLKIDEY